ncbi:glycosyltransferase family 1 protein [Parashewanella spongiae]|uniref:Glycosyltransferase family 1 protein n=1 Tax=Parashewanella spongiae TaxID=342950 RepID=A0A3A6TQF5_9GAMM|nr:glycosyltransferase family 4 protein [Parashewanella spongiae]MCL1077687.1 glycosyltransferase family 4 protein [Parashewanella spongiae]RJY18228.1 glycosyltransferase family 1 protein [Parashewanella spongiae]
MKKKIIFVCSYAPSLVTFRGDLITKFVNEGWSVTCLAPSSDNVLIEKITALGAEFVNVEMDRKGINIFSDIKYFLSLIQKIRSIKPSIVLAYTIKPVIYSSIASFLCKVPLRVSLVTGLGESFSSIRTFNLRSFTDFKSYLISYCARSLFKLGLYCSTNILFQNNDDKNMILESSSLRSDNMNITNGSGVNLAHYPFRKRYLTALDTLRFVMVSRIIKPKGVMHFLECARNIKKTYQNVEFHLVGWFDEGSDILSSDLQPYILNGDIIFHGKLDNVYTILNKCDIFVLPSYYPEGTPRTILEAMSSGMPIITTDSVGCRETVLPEYNGYLITTKSTCSLEKSCEHFLNNRDLVTSLGKNSYALASEKYCVHNVNRHIFEILGI